jgi:hypothetical protein
VAALPRRPLLLIALVVAGCGGEPGGPDSGAFEQRSRAVGETLEHRVLVPEGAADEPPLLVLLHGRGGGPEGMVSDDLVDALDAHRDGVDVPARRLRARRLAALDEFTVEHGERALRARGGRSDAERFLREQEEGLDVPGLVAVLEERAAGRP